MFISKKNRKSDSGSRSFRLVSKEATDFVNSLNEKPKIDPIRDGVIEDYSSIHKIKSIETIKDNCTLLFKNKNEIERQSENIDDDEILHSLSIKSANINRELINKEHLCPLTSDNSQSNQCSCDQKSKRKSDCGMLCQYSNPITQLSIIKKLKLEKDHVYAISVEWYEKWCDFVNVGFTTPDNLVSPSDDVSNIPFVKNLNYNKNPGDDFNDITLSNHSSDDGCSLIQQIRASSQILNEDYSNPGKIINKQIAETRTKVTSALGSSVYNLKPYLQEIHDYMIVPAQIWHCLKKWYGCDYEVIIS